MRPIAAIALAAVAALAGCKQASSLYCDELDPTCPGGYYCETGQRICMPAVDGSTHCDQSTPCAEPLPYCLNNTCVECGGNPDCLDNPLPVCGPDNTCIGCDDDSDCDASSGVCREDGACENANVVVYVEPGAAATGECTVDTPCDLDYGVTMVVDAVRSVVHLAPGVYDIDQTLVIDSFDTTLIGRGAEIHYNTVTGGSAITVDGQAANLYYLEVHGAQGNTGTQGNGVRCTAGGTLAAHHVVVHDNDAAGFAIDGCTADLADVEIHTNAVDGISLTSNGSATVIDGYIHNNNDIGVLASMGTHLEVRRSVVRNNVGGGLDLAGGPHTIENSIITRNGSPGSDFGGVRLGFNGGVFRFNTVAGNVDSADDNDGIICAGELTGSSNIFDDDVNTGNCSMNYTIYTTASDPPTGGTSNQQDVDPALLFVSTTVGDPDYYRTKPTSPAVNTAEAAADVTVDVDGDPRPSPANAARDIGADEVQP